MCCLSLSTLTAQEQSNSFGLHGRATVASFGLSQDSFVLHGRTAVASFGLSQDRFGLHGRTAVASFGLSQDSFGLHGRATVASFGLSQDSFGLHGRTTVASFGLSCTDAFRATVDGFGLDPLASDSIIYSFGLVWIGSFVGWFHLA